MTDRDKIIKGLEELQAWLKHLQTVGYHGDMPEYRERELTVLDALALLREQEARILTREEIIGWGGYVWKEFRGMRAMKALLIDNGMEREPYAGDFPTKQYKWGTYNRLWRCWSAQPTKEQREAVKWDA